MAIADIIVRIATDASRAADDVDAAAGKFGKFQERMSALAVPAGIAVGAIAAFGKQAVDSASATQQAMGAVDSVFGASAGVVKQWAADAAGAVGLSQSAYGDLAAVAGASLKSMGMSQADAADQTGKLITLGADLAATFGGTTAEAVGALTSALRGEADPAERLGLKLNQTTVAARMAADGTDKLTGTALDAAKAQTIMQLATEQASGANGQFARETDSAAGSAQIAAAQYENAKSALGTGLLPVVAAVTEKFAGLAQWVGENSDLVLTLVGIIGGLAAAVLAVNAAMAVASAAQVAWTAIQAAGKIATAAMTAAQWAFNAAMAANPVGLVILAVAALIAGIILLWNNCEGFRNFFIDLWNKVGAAAEAAWNWIKETAAAAWDAVVGTVSRAAQAVQDGVGAAVDWIVGKWTSLKDFVAGVWQAITSSASDAWNNVKSTITGVWDAIKSAIGSVVDWIVDKWNAIKSAGTACWNAIKSALDALMTPFRAIKDAVSWLIDKLKAAWDWASKLIAKIPFVGSFLSSAPAVAAAPSAATSIGLRSGISARAGTRRAGAGAGTQIIVQGALDPVAVANQIESLLLRQRRRLGGVAL